MHGREQPLHRWARKRRVADAFARIDFAASRERTSERQRGQKLVYTGRATRIWQRRCGYEVAGARQSTNSTPSRTDSTTYV